MGGTDGIDCMGGTGGWCGDAPPDPHLRNCEETRDHAYHQTWVTLGRMQHRWSLQSQIAMAVCTLGTLAFMLAWIIYVSQHTS